MSLAWATWDESMSHSYPFRDRIVPETERWHLEPRVGAARLSMTSSSVPASGPPSILALIGDTPLVRLSPVRWALAPDVSVLVKIEGQNPGGSVKDRAALSIIREAQRSGRLRPGRTLLDATSGNTGIAHAMLGAALDSRVHLTLPTNVSLERLQILRAYGAELALIDPAAGTDGAQALAEHLAGREPVGTSTPISMTTVPIAWPTTRTPSLKSGARQGPDHSLHGRPSN